MKTIPADALAAMLPVIAQFERMGIDYYVGGSIASSLFGVGRSTLDVDIIADMTENQVELFVQALRSIYYIDGNMIREAIRRRSCFNLIHLTTSYKIDVFVLKNRKFDHQSMSRRRRDTLHDEDKLSEIYLSSPEDILLAKLEWYRLGDEISDKQWNDILGIMKIQQKALDRPYLEKWAGELGVGDLLAKACQEFKMDED